MVLQKNRIITDSGSLQDLWREMPAGVSLVCTELEVYQVVWFIKSSPYWIVWLYTGSMENENYAAEL